MPRLPDGKQPRQNQGSNPVLPQGFAIPQVVQGDSLPLLETHPFAIEVQIGDLTGAS